MQKLILFFYSGTCSDDTVILATNSPPAIQSISWNPQQANATQTALLSKLDIMQDETGNTNKHNKGKRRLERIF
jgi:hypothetical protein